MKKLSFLINCIIVLAIVLMLVSGCDKVSNKQDFILVAHRGGVVDENVSENSLKGLEEAINRGYTHVEIDVRVTKDGHAVCFHDNNLKREVGVDKNISDLTLIEMKQLKLIKSQETIPTFEVYCAKCEGRINVMVDTKGVADRYVEMYSNEIESALDKFGLLKDALFIFNRTPINNQDKVADWFLGKAMVSFRKSLEEAKILENTLNEKLHQNYFVFNSPIDFSKEDINGFQKLGMKIIPSINIAHYKTGDPMKQGLADVKKMLDWGVDGLQIDSCYDSLVFARIE
jgi:glycerophosphoryl diester phosphodiesterase